MNTNLQYIEDNFIEWKELCKQAEITNEVLTELISKNLIPSPSYSISSEIKITSALQDEFVIIRSEKYFNKNVLSLVREHKSVGSTEVIKASFRDRFLNQLLNHNGKHYAYGNLFKEEFPVDPEKLEEAFEEEWTHYCKGVYGICTLNATPEEIVKKEIAVKKLIAFMQVNETEQLSEESKEKLKDLNSSFNEIASLFAPYQRATSSRGKYLDKLLEANSLNELITRY